MNDKPQDGGSVDVLRQWVEGDSGNCVSVNQRYADYAEQCDLLAGQGFLIRIDDGSDPLWRDYRLAGEARQFYAECRDQLTDPFEVVVELTHLRLSDTLPKTVDDWSRLYARTVLEKDAEIAKLQERVDDAEFTIANLTRNLAEAQGRIRRLRRTLGDEQDFSAFLEHKYSGDRNE